MQIFVYKAYAEDGKMETGEVEAPDYQSAVDQLYAKGLYPYETKHKAEHSQRWWEKEILESNRIKGRDLASITREFATLLSADIPLDETLRIVAAQMPNAKLKRFCLDLLDKVISGSSLSRALSQSTLKLPDYYINLVHVGEMSGNLGTIFQQLATFIEHSESVQSRIRSALIYPAILLAMALGAIVLISSFLIPNLMPIFEGSGAQTPFFIDFVMGTRALIAGWWPLMLASVFMIFIGVVSVFNSQAGRLAFDRLVLRLPVIGAMIKENETGKFSRSLGILLGNGIPLLQALGIVKNIASNQAFHEAMQISTDQLKEGNSLYSILAKTGIFPDLSLRLIKVGEESAKLDEMLLHAAQIFETGLQRKIDRIMTWFSPAITIFIGLSVGGLIMSVMNAILSVNELAL